MADKTFQVRYTGGLADVEIDRQIVKRGEVVDVSEDTAARIAEYDDWELVDPKATPKAKPAKAPTGG